MRILIAECTQEISSFNPLQSQYEDYAFERGDVLVRHRGMNTHLGGALSVFDKRDDAELVWTMAARAPSAGILSADGWARLKDDLLSTILPHAGKVDAIYFSLHGAMGAVGEPDPEGALLEAVRGAFGDLPLVISLDLHGILTDRMLRQVDGLTIYQTYPHVDFADTGARAARLLLDIADRGLKPVIARVTVPLLARGDECITKTGWYGDVLREGQLLERKGQALAAGVMIGNPFTDAPELCTQAIVVAESDAAFAQQAATHLATRMWEGRQRLVGKLIPIESAVELAKGMPGTVAFTDAADATSSGASGDSNVLVKALRDGGYKGRVLAQIVDAPAAAAAHRAGVGQRLKLSLGGTVDGERFTPMPVEVMVESLSRGRAKLETMGLHIDGGLTAVVTFDNFIIVVLSKPAFLMDRSLYYSNGLDPVDFDLVVVKSPHTEFQMYDLWVSKNFNVDAPGSTSANVASLGHTLCARPIYPIEPDTNFVPKPTLYRRAG
ncbi:M81 family metallopeptidase [Devosia sp. 66-22]|uniref:M81 family metallopeptidase n=1 Tax=Devosia sp. 66-22 TaxID=1895753 RepID=UPI00092A1DF2|nr:M81 family metallopeptidase [Devosia sp. 66-22]OJX50754.1 MAG: microcystin degradation protein MlrC [Devosia sp. 66-22]